ncbi:hypothetical protein [Mycobacterium sp. 94-17]|uniref:hypothetical protein n=1 Tax=Mycobacterium sp. 94-17 TaxID=2986147 RepID=UPI002D1F8D65|nr:hypothetical protein [Mycobacterium sp. 94-17]MEB4209774.1 hypothetical protein [Mycobacterium sp. 94-17]
MESLNTATVVRETVRVDVTDVAPPGCRTVAAEIVAPATPPTDPIVLACFAGGAMSRAYFDLAATGYSFAQFAAHRGVVVVLVDHPGVGESDVPDDAWLLTPGRIAAVHSGVVTRVLALLRAGNLGAIDAVRPAVVIGVGHSAGADLLVRQQANHHSYHGLCLLGWGLNGLPAVLCPAAVALTGSAAADAELVAAAREQFELPLPYLEQASAATRRPSSVHDALGAARTALLAVVATAAMIPGTTSVYAAAIDVPLFLGAGSRDLVTDLRQLPAAFPSATDITTYVLDGAGHNHNSAPGRAVLWERILHWASCIHRHDRAEYRTTSGTQNKPFEEGKVSWAYSTPSPSST